MKKRILLVTMYSLFVICTIFMIFIAYKKINSPLAGMFANGYVIFVFLFLFYIILTTILNMRKLKWSEIRKKLFKFFAIFIIFSVINILLTYLIKGEVNILNNLFTPLGLAFGITFVDLLFKQKNINPNS